MGGEAGLLAVGLGLVNDAGLGRLVERGTDLAISGAGLLFLAALDGVLVGAFEGFEVVATIEEHSRLGGFGGSVAEWLSEQDPQPASLLRFGTSDEFLHDAGDQAYAREANGLTAKGIADAIVKGARRDRRSGAESTR